MFASGLLLSLRQIFLEEGVCVGVEHLAEICHATGYKTIVDPQPGTVSQYVIRCVNGGTVHDEHDLSIWPLRPYGLAVSCAKQNDDTR